MMWKILPLAILQSALLAGGQVMMKIAMMRLHAFSFTWRFVRTVLVDWQLAVGGLLFLLASLLWMYMLKVFPLSIAYPLVSLSYVFGMVAAVVVFHENVPPTRWAGVGLIMAGCCLIAK